MALSPENIAAIAELLDNARSSDDGVTKVTDSFPHMTHDDAYAVQDALRGLATSRGERLVGLKMGLTSRAKMKQMGVESPIRGFLTDAHVVMEGTPIDTAELIHPKVEPELAVITKTALRGPGVDRAQAMASIDMVVAALEIIDSRYENFRFDLTSVIADNTSAARFITSTASVLPDAVDLATLGVVFEKNGELVATGAGAAVLGHPAESLAELANMLGEIGGEIPAGTLVLLGGITAAVRVHAGDTVTARFQHLGALSASFR